MALAELCGDALGVLVVVLAPAPVEPLVVALDPARVERSVRLERGVLVDELLGWGGGRPTGRRRSAG